MDSGKGKIVVAVTGASGSLYTKVLLEDLCGLNQPPEEIAVVFSDTAYEIWKSEIGTDFYAKQPVRLFDNSSYFAPFASGSCGYDTMIICPASMGTIGRIASCTSDDLISRAADVMLKERKKLIVVPREAPYNLIHIENFKRLTMAGAIICPASPSFYSGPKTIRDLVTTITDRIINLAGFEKESFRWME
jgi:flavin prenyltransferase